jgi:hypothetical protein
MVVRWIRSRVAYLKRPCFTRFTPVSPASTLLARFDSPHPLYPCFTRFTPASLALPLLRPLRLSSPASTPHRPLRLPIARFDYLSPASTTHRPLRLPIARFDYPSPASTTHRPLRLPIARFDYLSPASTTHRPLRLPIARFDSPRLLRLPREGQLGVLSYFHFPFIIPLCNYCSNPLVKERSLRSFSVLYAWVARSGSLLTSSR